MVHLLATNEAYLIKRNLPLNIVLVIMLTIFLLMMTMLFELFYPYYFSINRTAQLREEGAYFVKGVVGTDITQGYEDIADFGRVDRYSYISAGRNLKIHAVSDFLLSAYDLPLSKGEWKYGIEGNTIYGIALPESGYFIGEVITLPIGYDLEISGILAKRSDVPASNSTQPMVFNTLFESQVNSYDIICENTVFLGTESYLSYPNYIVRFKESTTQNQKNEFLTAMSNLTLVSGFDTIYDNTVEQGKSEFLVFLPWILSIVIVSVPLLALSALYFLKKNIRYFSLLNILGGTDGLIHISMLIHNVIIFLLSLAISITVILLSDLYMYGFELLKYSLLATAIAHLAIILLSTLFVLGKNKSYNEILKEAI